MPNDPMLRSQDNAHSALPAGMPGEQVNIPVPVRLFFWYLAAITVFGKGPAYLLFPPFFLGEMLMMLLLAWSLLRWFAIGFPSRIIGLLFALVIIFILLGATHLIHDYRQFGQFALRDSSLWYYGCFYIIGVYIATMPGVANWLWRRLIWAWIVAMVWWVINRHTGEIFIKLGPEIPWRQVPLLGGSGSENVQHMSCAMILLMLGFPGRARRSWKYAITVIAIILALSTMLGTYARGVKIAVIVSWFVGWIATLGASTPLWPAGRKYVAAYCIVIILAILAIAKGPGGLYRAGGLERYESALPNQTKGTAFWRLKWWNNIYKEVTRIDPMNGLGFGINLSQYNPSLKGHKWQYPVRSPHNINMTVFGRMGFIGSTIWALILVFGIGGLFIRTLRGGVHGQAYTIERHKEVTFWLIFLLMTWINSSFAVLMEGPVLGIWFWFALGFGTGRSVDQSGLISRYKTS